MITFEIDLTNIPASSRREWTDKDGKKHISANFVMVDMKEPDKYGNTKTVYMQQSKEERENKAPKCYVGKGKELTFNNTPKESSKPEDVINLPDKDSSQLPF